MKQVFFIFLLLPLYGWAQDCKNFIYMTNNARVVMTVYDRKGDASGTNTWTVSDAKQNGKVYQASVSSQFNNEKGKEIAKSKGIYICEGGTLKADIRMSMPQQQMEAYKDAEAKFDAVYLEYPSNIAVGQTLPDANFKMDVEQKGGLSTRINFNQVNRKVVSKETIASPAGTWEAFQISFDATFRAQLGGIGIPFTISGKEWFVPGLGIVKTESYNKSGKLMGSTLITSITK
jgi:hypothetical protein